VTGEQFSLIILALGILVITAIMIANFIYSSRTTKELEEIDEDNEKFREFIETVFNPFDAVHEYLDRKVIILSKTEFFTYDKTNPKYKLLLRKVYNSKNDRYYLVCEKDNAEIVVIDVV
jgi:hypothetical protein